MTYIFKNEEDYKRQRQAFVDAAQGLIDCGKIEDANAKMKDVEELDAAYADFSTAQANLRAMSDTGRTAPKIVTNMSGTTQNSTDDIYNSVDYRNAFMAHVVRGEAIPAQFVNADANTKTSDVSVLIPTTVMERIIEKMEATGMILPLVTRTAYKGGLSIPTSTAKPTASWVTEGSGSDKQKKTTGSITFNYYKLRCAISVSLETDTMALAVFETTFVNNVSEAMVKALEQAIINGDGSGKPKGILSETVADGQNVELTEGTAPTYADLIDAEAKLPLAYENGAVWFMTKKTFMTFVSMTDQDGQPIARVNYGIGGSPERTLLGRRVILNDYMPSYSSAVEADTVIAFLFNPKDYILNTNLNLTIKKYEDNDTDDMVTKAVMLVDGKVVDKNSLVTVTVKNS